MPKQFSIVRTNFPSKISPAMVITVHFRNNLFSIFLIVFVLLLRSTMRCVLVEISRQPAKKSSVNYDGEERERHGYNKHKSHHRKKDPNSTDEKMKNLLSFLYGLYVYTSFSCFFLPYYQKIHVLKCYVFVLFLIGLVNLIPRRIFTPEIPRFPLLLKNLKDLL